MEAIGKVLERSGLASSLILKSKTPSGSGIFSIPESELTLREKTGNTYMSTLDPEKIYRHLLEAGNDWADKESAADLLEESKKIVLAELQNQQSEAKSVAAAEALALCSPRYLEHIKAMCEARRVANRAKVLYDSLKALMELRRSQESTRRAEAGIR